MTQLRPGDPRAWFALGRALGVVHGGESVHGDRVREGAAAFARARSLDPESADAWSGELFARVLIANSVGCTPSEWAHVRSLSADAVARFPEAAWAHRASGDVLDLDRDEVAAEAAWARASSLAGGARSSGA